MPAIKLGDLLIKARAISEAQLKSALTRQQKWGGRLGEIFVEMNILTEEMLVKALSKQLAVPAVNLDSIPNIPPEVRDKLPKQMAADYTCVPVQLRDHGRTLVLAMAEPQNIEQIDSLRAVTGCRIMVQVAGRTAISRAFTRFYVTDGEAVEASDFGVFESSRTDGAFGAAEHTVPPTRLEAIPSIAPVVEPARTTQSQDALKLIKALEQIKVDGGTQLKALIEMLVEKGVFTKEEYLARLKR